MLQRERVWPVARLWYNLDRLSVRRGRRSRRRRIVCALRSRGGRRRVGRSVHVATDGRGSELRTVVRGRVGVIAGVCRRWGQSSCVSFCGHAVTGRAGRSFWTRGRLRRTSLARSLKGTVLTLRRRLVVSAGGDRRRTRRLRGVTLAILRLRRTSVVLLSVVSLRLLRLPLRVERECRLESSGAASPEEDADDQDDEGDRHCDCLRRAVGDDQDSHSLQGRSWRHPVTYYRRLRLS